MKIEYFHASKFGNGAMVAEEFKQQMNVKGVSVDVHHIREMKRKELAPADLYVFSSPGRMGRPIGSVRRAASDLRGQAMTSDRRRVRERRSAPAAPARRVLGRRLR